MNTFHRCTHAYTCSNAEIYTYTQINTYTRHSWLHTGICTHIYYTYIHSKISIHICIHKIYTDTHIHTSHVCTGRYTHTYIHTYTHTHTLPSGAPLRIPTCISMGTGSMYSKKQNCTPLRPCVSCGVGPQLGPGLHHSPSNSLVLRLPQAGTSRCGLSRVICGHGLTWWPCSDRSELPEL